MSLDTVTCLMCRGTFAIERKPSFQCEANVISANGDNFDGHCHSCGELFDEPPPDVVDPPNVELGLLVGFKRPAD